MKVVVVAPEYPPTTIGGGAAHVYKLVQHLCKKCSEIVVFTTTLEKESFWAKPTILEYSNLRILSFPPIPLPNFSWPIEWKTRLPKSVPFITYLLRELDQEDVIVHIHGYGHVPSDVAAILSKLRRKRYVLTVHGFPREPHRRGQLYQLAYFLYSNSLSSLTLRWADSTIAVSRTVADECVHGGVSPQAVRVIYNGISTEEFLELPDGEEFRARHGVKNGKIIVCIGRLSWVKGFQHVILALPLVKEKIPDAKLVLVGRDGGYLTELRRVANETGMSDSVLFLGWATNRETRAALSAADVVVVPSLYEPFGMVALEAMAAGKVLAASNTSGLAELLDHEQTALMFDAGDYRSLARAVVRALTDPSLREEMPRKAKKKAACFSWQRAADKTFQAYVEVLQKGNGN